MSSAANLFRPNLEIALFDFLLPIVLFMLPVLVIVLLALAFGRRLSGSCGGVNGQGQCSRCGKPAAEMPAPNAKVGPCS